MGLAQSGNLQQRFTSARKHAEKITFFGAGFVNKRGPLCSSGPTRGGGGGRVVQFRRGF
jgi:hypothetical protein